MEKMMIVTGANSGMGLASTVALAKTGAEVVMVCRNEQRGQAALVEAIRQSGSDKIQLMLCDLGSLTSIREFAKAFTERYDRLDVLLNNAGVVMIKRQETSDGFEMDLGVNHLGHFLLTHLLLDVLLASPQGRVVSVASGAYKAGKIHFDDPFLKRGFNPAKAYAQSKLANILFTKELASRLEGTHVTANCVHPGAVGTQIGVNRDTGFGKTVLAMLKPFFLTPEKGAETAVYLATAPELEKVSGQYFYKKNPQKLSTKADSTEDAKRLWEWSCEQVGIAES
ncbi:SDR family NAD(P)-dependent oxidoreductase [Paenibacillus sp. HJL G12]|uniref:SDR family NAD(P)-dependent oxidoreductase n=1 Tax=Paenibacillus dendrobii TaxID=2691084 RepID=A0A7X3II33_9BACL|nr:SDR family oxidoreductase [Paenibacillus dendrobii]MWV44354.1 SDR family NAD(P)-dependent oxidoreductase [Paenibacillus dendrobii]